MWQVQIFGNDSNKSRLHHEEQIKFGEHLFPFLYKNVKVKIHKNYNCTCCFVWL